jgi:nucleotide-binding universal stress UspA family protein
LVERRPVYRGAVLASQRRPASPDEAACAGAGAKDEGREDSVTDEAIIAAAKKKRCDLIVMGSHGRSGLAGLVLGSQTSKVLTHSKVPVLVAR